MNFRQTFFSAVILCASLQSTPSHALLAFDRGDEGPLNFWSASQQDWQAAPCKNIEAPSLTDIEIYIQEEAGGGSRKRVVGGVNFNGESKRLLKAFKQLAANKNLQQMYAINPGCDKVMCAVEKIWGRELGLKILYMKLKHGFNGSEYAFSDTSRFNIDEIDEALITLADLPPHLQELALGDQRLLPSAPGSKHPSGNAVADSSVKLYDTWRSGQSGFNTSYYRQQTLLHELGHVMGFHGGLFQKHSTPEWRGLHKSAGCSISVYSNTNHIEDFAESFAAYRYNANNLKETCPAKYEYMKTNIYAGVEYTDDIACTREPIEKKKKKFRLKDLFESIR